MAFMNKALAHSVNQPLDFSCLRNIRRGHSKRAKLTKQQNYISQHLNSSLIILKIHRIISLLKEEVQQQTINWENSTLFFFS